MAKKKKKNKETTIENYYDLRVKEMDELVSALKGDTDEAEAEPVTMDISEITGEEVTGSEKKKKFDPYRRDKLSAIPVWLKAIFIKWWFAGCVCYFFIMGLGIGTNTLDLVFIVGAMLGVVTDVLVNPAFRFMESDNKEFNAYMMFPFPFKQFWTFFTNAIYYIFVVGLVGALYTFINEKIFTTTVGVEPLLFGTFCVIVDMAFIGIKDLIVYLVKRKKRKKEEIENV
ncbi:MAG: hypothetical protein NC033_00105 [Clostridiales bacterium]|nr:hypothetical protein [Clostridiales bacterium]